MQISKAVYRTLRGLMEQWWFTSILEGDANIVCHPIVSAFTPAPDLDLWSLDFDPDLFGDNLGSYLHDGEYLAYRLPGGITDAFALTAFNIRPIAYAVGYTTDKTVYGYLFRDEANDDNVGYIHLDTPYVITGSSQGVVPPLFGLTFPPEMIR